jgi:hypothetical protein
MNPDSIRYELKETKQDEEAEFDDKLSQAKE